MNTVTSPLAKRSHTWVASNASRRLARRPDGERRERDVDEPVDVVQRQHEHRAVGRRPGPRLDHPVDHRGQRPVGVHDALRSARSCRSCRSSAPGGRGSASSGARDRGRRRRRRRCRPPWRGGRRPRDEPATRRPRRPRCRRARRPARDRGSVGAAARRWHRRASRRGRRRRGRARLSRRMATRSPWATGRAPARRTASSSIAANVHGPAGSRIATASPWPATRSWIGAVTRVDDRRSAGREPGRFLEGLGGPQQVDVGP